ncbi:MAG: ABC transporter ATP-binding protein [Myxococcota bacterium]
MADVVLEGVVKRYAGDVLAVKGLDLHVEDGELMVLVGPSGCGKSTTLRMVAGLEDITSGELRIGGRRVNEVAPKDRDIAMVFQNYALYPHMTVRENMAFGLRLRKMPRPQIRERVQEAAETLGIEGLLGRKPKALSGGQRQRVAMGRAMVREPAVFLFDEPLSNLDAKLRVQMRLEIARLHGQLGTTTVYVTHDQIEAMTLADRIAVMSEGELQQLGTPMEIYHQPANRFVAGFIGSPAMNFVPGRLEGEGGGLAFVADGLRVPLSARQREAILSAGQPRGEVTLGVRPQQLKRAETEADFEGRVDIVERMGAESFVHLSVDGADVVARVPGDVAVTAGARLPIAVARDHVHLFAADGTNLLQGCIPAGDAAAPDTGEPS